MHMSLEAWMNREITATPNRIPCCICLPAREAHAGLLPAVLAAQCRPQGVHGVHRHQAGGLPVSSSSSSSEKKLRKGVLDKDQAYLKARKAPKLREFVQLFNVAA